MRIQTDAARALLAWKTFLEDEIVNRARILAKTVGDAETMTVDQFRAAAIPALEGLIVSIQVGEFSSANNKAA